MGAPIMAVHNRNSNHIWVGQSCFDYCPILSVVSWHNRTNNRTNSRPSLTAFTSSTDLFETLKPLAQLFSIPSMPSLDQLSDHSITDVRGVPSTAAVFFLPAVCLLLFVLSTVNMANFLGRQRGSSGTSHRDGRP